ncbi:MAG TPA: EamA family transporter [Actinomycetota bacterium]|nr:EamA family transporter [Actinomycetota bacterium]
MFHYLGPAFAVLLFSRIDVLGVAWLRIASAAVVFGLWRRPWRAWHRLPRGTQLNVVAWGFVLAVMNSCFYIAIDRLPLSTVAAIEFIGPIGLGVIGVRTRRNALALLLAASGVYVLTDIRIVAEPIGLVFAFANAALFTLYIVLGHRAAELGASSGIDLLGLSMLIAAVVATPWGIWDAGPGLLDPIALAAGVGVGVSSSVIPYVSDQLALARLARSTYALFVSLLPATATVVGIVVLRQVPSVVEVAGICLVIAGVAVHQEQKERVVEAPSSTTIEATM